MMMNDTTNVSLLLTGLYRLSVEVYVCIRHYSVSKVDAWYEGWTLMPFFETTEDLHDKNNLRNKNSMSSIINYSTSKACILRTGL